MTEERVRKLLLVDDDDAFREAMGLELTERGFQVLSAHDHRTALSLAVAHRPSCAIVDLRLENERGLEVVKDLVERVPGIRVVVLTGYGSVATAVEAVKLGAHHYLTKPCEPEALEAALSREGGDPSVACQNAPPVVPSVEPRPTPDSSRGWFSARRRSRFHTSPKSSTRPVSADTRPPDHPLDTRAAGSEVGKVTRGTTP